MVAEEFIDAMVRWARHDDRVVAAALVGSYARNQARPDSDIDFVLITPKPMMLLSDRRWLHTCGVPRVEPDEDWGLVQSIRVFYANLEVEFGIAGLEWVQPPIDTGTAEVIGQPIRVLYDPEFLLAIAITDVRII